MQPLACIAIQSNQNDQHGGQSIPDFDYGMANGVKKTYRKLYWTNLGKMLNLLFDIEGRRWRRRRRSAPGSWRNNDIYPILADDNGYKDIERGYLRDIIDEKFIDKLQKKATKYANEEVRRATYQAMEAFVTISTPCIRERGRRYRFPR